MNKDFEENEETKQNNIVKPLTNIEQREKAELAAVVDEVNKREIERKERERIAALELQKSKKEEKLKPSSSPINPNAQKEKKNLMKLGIIVLIFAVALIGYRFYLNNLNKPATQKTIEEQILETLQNRYGVSFTKINKETYQDSSNKKVTVKTNNNVNKLIVEDDYLNNIKIESIKSEITKVLKTSGINNVNIELEPEKDCYFIGSCMGKYYRASYIDNTDETKLSERSKEIVLKEYIDMDNVKFFNQIGFRIYIKITGEYSNYDKEMLKDSFKILFNELNKKGYKNKLGFEIEVKSKDGINNILKLTSDGDQTGSYDIYTAKES
ncbi:MAG: hypothetical protein ACI31M_01160 [Bacilli bacterium]